MLLFSKHHRLNVAPVVESMNSSVIGFVTQVIAAFLDALSLSVLFLCSVILDTELNRDANDRRIALECSDGAASPVKWP
jgi:hypothetical protein